MAIRIPRALLTGMVITLGLIAFAATFWLTSSGLRDMLKYGAPDERVSRGIRDVDREIARIDGVKMGCGSVYADEFCKWG